MKITTGQENIISMTDFVGKPRYPVLGQVEAYWQALRKGADVPFRAELDPRGIEGALEYAFIVERIAPGVARLRLAGRHLNDLMGMEVRGMPLTAFFAPEARKTLGLKLEEMFQTPAILTCTIEAEAGPGRGALPGRMLLLPLKSDLGDISRGLGCLVTPDDIGRTPRRFAVTQIGLRALRGIGTPRPAPAAPAPGFSDRPQLFGTARPMNGAKPRAPFLRVVKSDD